MFGGRPVSGVVAGLYIHAAALFRTWETREDDGKGGQAGTARNNAGLEKLKKRARRAAITSDVSRPNDRHLSRRSRCYAKSPLPFGDSARAASEGYKQTACLRFSFPVPGSNPVALAVAAKPASW